MSTPSTELETLDYPSVMKILGVARSTIQELEKRGFLQRLDIPMKGVRFARADVERVLRRHRAAIRDSHGISMIEIPEGQGRAATAQESRIELDEEFRMADAQAQVWPPDGEVKSDESDS